MAQDADADAEFIADESTLTLARRRKRFTLDGATRTLPLVGRIAADLARAHAEARRLHARLDFSVGRVNATAATLAARHDLELALDRVVQRLQFLVDELAEVGVEVRDYAAGRVDFVARHGGREVCLCWQPGDGPAIGYWHELSDEPDAPRRPIATLVG